MKTITKNLTITKAVVCMVDTDVNMLTEREYEIVGKYASENELLAALRIYYETSWCRIVKVKESVERTERITLTQQQFYEAYQDIATEETSTES